MKKVLFALTAVSAIISGQATAKVATANVTSSGTFTSGSCTVTATPASGSSIDFGTHTISSFTQRTLSSTNNNFAVHCDDPTIAALNVTGQTGSKPGFATDKNYATLTVTLKDMTVTKGTGTAKDGAIAPGLQALVSTSDEVNDSSNIASLTWRAERLAAGGFLFPSATAKAISVPQDGQANNAGSFTDWSGKFDVAAVIDKAELTTDAQSNSGTSTFSGTINFNLYYN